MKKLKLIEYVSVDLLRSSISECQDENHIQQVAFSTYHDALTQVCFTCLAVRTTIQNKVYEYLLKESVKEEALNLNTEIPTLRDVEEAKDHIKNGTMPSSLRIANIMERLQDTAVQGEEEMEELDLTFPDNEALADFFIQGSNEAEMNAACFQEAYKRLFKVAEN